MCASLVHLFSSYGIYNLAWELGVKFLDKLELNVDYCSTSRILEMIWVSSGIAIQHYLINMGLKEDYIMDYNNALVKTWYLYYRWASIWKGHKLGICTGNFDIQFSI